LYIAFHQTLRIMFNFHLPKDINIHITIKQDNKTLEDLCELANIINQKISKIMTNTDQALSDLQVISSTLTKVSGETTTLLQKITDLENATTPDTPQSVLDAIAAVRAQAEAIDQLVPDAPPTEPQA